MKIRILLGAVMIAVIVLLFWLDHHFDSRAFVGSVVCLVGVAGWWEFSRMSGVAANGGRALSAVGFVATAWFLAFAWLDSARTDLPAALSVLGFAALVFGAFVSVLFRGDFRTSLHAVLATIAGALLFGFLFSHVLRIYFLPRGLLLGVVFLFGAKGNDIIAYFSGRAFGRRRFLKVSPGKTLEGCSGAVVFSVVWFVAAGQLWPELFFRWPQSIVLGIIFSVATQVGDLAESLLKRAYEVKDSAALLPEFGGVLDLIDSTLFSGFLFWFVFALTQ